MIDRLFRRALRLFYRYRRKHDDAPTIYELKDKIENILDGVQVFCRSVIPLLACISFGLLIYDAGFNPFFDVDLPLYKLWRGVAIAATGLVLLNFLIELRRHVPLRSRVFNVLLAILCYIIQHFSYIIIHSSPSRSPTFTIDKLLVFTCALILFLTVASELVKFIYRKGVNPAFLFVTSFLALIIIGSLLLLLPNATHQGIKPVDAWFTSASAVCVTGLSVVDTATTFTHIGKLIILILIQMGGLGIMTFAGLLGYLSAGSVSFRNQLALKDMLSSDRIGNVLSFVTRVIVVTIFFELIGAVLIYSTLRSNEIPDQLERIFFSVFHSISAFCNAGFSTYTNGLYELPVRFNYGLHLVIAALIILGGMGFPIVFNLFTYLRQNTLKPLYTFLRIHPKVNINTHLVDSTAKLALKTTGILLCFGFVTFFFFEQDASMKEHSTVFGKIVTAFFGSVTPRTAGFNTVNMADFTLPTIMIYLLLMWIGASPASTGGGIKTTVIAVAFLNVISVIRGKDRTEYNRIQIADNSIHRAFAIIFLSLVVLGITVLLLSLNEPDKQLFAIAFEAFSAFGTVGLTLGITPELSISSKILLSFVMLIGRVGTLTLLFAFVTPARQMNYRYPKEEITL